MYKHKPSIRDTPVDIGKLAEVKSCLVSLQEDLDDLEETETVLEGIGNLVGTLDGILSGAKTRKLGFSEVTEKQFQSLMLANGDLYFDEGMISNLVQQTTEATAIEIASLRKHILDLYQYVNMDHEPGPRAVIDSVLLSLAKIYSTDYPSQKVAIFPQLKLGDANGVMMPNASYETVYLTGCVDYGVISYKNEAQNTGMSQPFLPFLHFMTSPRQLAKLLSQSGTKKCLKFADSLFFLLKDKHVAEVPLSMYIPEAVSQAIALHSVMSGKPHYKHLDEVRFCLTNGKTWIFLVLKRKNSGYVYYDSAPLSLLPEALERSDMQLRRLMRLLLEWIIPPPSSLYNLKN
ncbi:hypothetical protein HGRIS_001812 [Hohenbuehelia grisea]|uniref:Uncharacterized protein n=1 Tax=Hohenbuehelia grisea TaxID=104357 RepID=A0ABR3JIJ3_9AGAR